MIAAIRQTKFTRIQGTFAAFNLVAEPSRLVRGLQRHFNTSRGSSDSSSRGPCTPLGPAASGA